MAKNDPAKPEVARAAQDVEAPKHVHTKELEGTYHWGRGGEGNKVTLGEKDRGKSGERPGAGEKKERAGSFRDTVEKGKKALGLGNGNGKVKGAEESAIED